MVDEDDGPTIGHAARYRRNALVILAEQLSGIPTWVYQENPLLAVLLVSRPRRGFPPAAPR